MIAGSGAQGAQAHLLAPEPAINEVRRAVRAALEALPAPARGTPLLVGCSGGADSLALTLAAATVRGADGVRGRRRRPPAAGRVGRTRRSHGRAARRARRSRRGSSAVDVTGPGGIEAAARRARRAALRAARPHPDSPILLGHTLDDQAETVLLGPRPGLRRTLARGHAAVGRAVAAPAAHRPTLDDAGGVRRARPARLGRPAQRRPALHPRPAARTRCCRCWRTCSPAGSPRPSPAPPPSSGRTPTRSTPSPAQSPGRRGRPAHHACGAEAAHAPGRRCRLDQRLCCRPPELAAHAPPDALPPPHTPWTAHTHRPRCAGPDTGCASARAEPDADHDTGSTGTDPHHGTDHATAPDAHIGDELDLTALDGARPPCADGCCARGWAQAGVTGLTDAHLRAADVLAGRGPDRAGVAVPGGLELVRAHGRLGIRPVRWPSAR